MSIGRAIAVGNNDVALVAWAYDAPIDNCLGFAVLRATPDDATATPLPAWVGWSGDSNDNWQPRTTQEWPVQKYIWRDLTAHRGATYRYEIVPMVGSPGALQPRDDLTLTTAPVTLTPQRSDHVQAYFNRGILSTQHLAHSLPQGPSGGPSGTSLMEHVKTPGDALRNSLAGQQIEALSSLLKKAAVEGGHCYGALYELDDPELVDLLDAPGRVSLVLSDAGGGGDPDSTNAGARARLHHDGVDVTDRMLPSGHIGHDKFLVYADPAGTPTTVLTGSTNWTYTGLCAQSNNALLIEDPTLAQTYVDFANRLAAECPTGNPATQSAQLRTDNDVAHPFSVDGADVTVWFSPNTKLTHKPADSPPMPSDLSAVHDLIANAQQGILFLLFQPGKPSVLDAIAEAEAAGSQSHLFIRGAATDPDAIGSFETELHHRPGEPVVRVAAAAAIGGQPGTADDQFAYWQHELLKSPGGHAIIHDKILVIDPFSPDCVVVTGSHNLGYQASYSNDENLVIVKGHRGLAEAYAVHVMDVYDHYRWRWTLQQYGDKSFSGLARTPAWQDKYASKPGDDAAFWLAGTQPQP